MKVILTNMVMVYKDDGSFLVQNRIKNDWPGINFPGGHIEKNETMEESAFREIKEETGLILDEVVCCGSYSWLDFENNKHHLCILYRTNKFHGELVSSNEGEVFFIKENDLNKYQLSLDFGKILEICMKGVIDGTFIASRK